MSDAVPYSAEELQMMRKFPAHGFEMRWLATVDALRRELDAERERVSEHHASHVMRLLPGNVCPVCTPPSDYKWGDEIPEGEPFPHIIERMVRRCMEIERDRDEAVGLLREAMWELRTRKERKFSRLISDYLGRPR